MKWLAPVAFSLFLLGHILYATQGTGAVADGGAWASFEFDEPEPSRLARYVESGNVWLGLSYGLSGAFAAFCFARILRLRRESVAAAAGGLTLSGVLWAGVCFMTGCCGSPMLPLYLGLFGPRFVSITKPLTFGLTLLSILVGYAWMLKTAEKAVRKNVNARLHEALGADPGQV